MEDAGKMAAENHGVNLFIHTSDSKDRFLYIDDAKILQVFINLIENGCQVLKGYRNGKDCSEENEIHTTFQWEGDSLMVTIADNGPGIPPNILDEIFLPFISARDGGTGLGLSNVKRFIELHGGSVKAKNGDNGGAVFTIILH